MKVFSSIGSKERFLEMYQNVNKFKLNENSNTGLESYDILNDSYNKFKTGELKINQTNTFTDDNETYVEVDCTDGSINVKFTFKIQFDESSQDEVYNVSDAELTEFQFNSNEKTFSLERDMLSDFNLQHGSEFYDLVQDYVEIDDDPVLTSLYEDMGKKIDSMPYGHHSDDIQKSVNYGDNKPVNKKLRVASKPNKYVPVINENIDNIVSSAIEKGIGSMGNMNKSSIIAAAKKSVDDFVESNKINILSRQEYSELVKDVANKIYTSYSSLVNERRIKPSDREVPSGYGGKMNADSDMKNDYDNLVDYDTDFSGDSPEERHNIPKPDEYINPNPHPHYDIKDDYPYNSPLHEKDNEPIPNELGGNVQSQIPDNADEIEPRLPTHYGEGDSNEDELENELDDNQENSNGDEELEGGLGDGKEPMEFDNKQILRGIEVEMEHTDDPKVALEIAMDHLTEDPEYYTKHDSCYDEESELTDDSEESSSEDDMMRDKLLGYQPKNVGSEI